MEVKLKVLVEDCGDGDLVPFVTSERTLAEAKDQVPNAIILHEMVVADADGPESFGVNGRQNLATALDTLLTLSSFMSNCEVEDVLMKMFQEGMKAGMQHARETSVVKPIQTGVPSQSLVLSQEQR